MADDSNPLFVPNYDISKEEEEALGLGTPSNSPSTSPSGSPSDDSPPAPLTSTYPTLPDSYTYANTLAEDDLKTTDTLPNTKTLLDELRESSKDIDLVSPNPPPRTPRPYGYHPWGDLYLRRFRKGRHQSPDPGPFDSPLTTPLEDILHEKQRGSKRLADDEWEGLPPPKHGRVGRTPLPSAPRTQVSPPRPILAKEEVFGRVRTKRTGTMNLAETKIEEKTHIYFDE